MERTNTVYIPPGIMGEIVQALKTVGETDKTDASIPVPVLYEICKVLDGRFDVLVQTIQKLCRVDEASDQKGGEHRYHPEASASKRQKPIPSINLQSDPTLYEAAKGLQPSPEVEVTDYKNDFVDFTNQNPRQGRQDQMLKNRTTEKLDIDKTSAHDCSPHATQVTDQNSVKSLAPDGHHDGVHWTGVGEVFAKDARNQQTSEGKLDTKVRSRNADGTKQSRWANDVQAEGGEKSVSDLLSSASIYLSEIKLESFLRLTTDTGLSEDEKLEIVLMLLSIKGTRNEVLHEKLNFLKIGKIGFEEMILELETKGYLSDEHNWKITERLEEWIEVIEEHIERTKTKSTVDDRKEDIRNMSRYKEKIKQIEQNYFTPELKKTRLNTLFQILANDNGEVILNDIDDPKTKLGRLRAFQTHLNRGNLANYPKNTKQKCGTTIDEGSPPSITVKSHNQGRGQQRKEQLPGTQQHGPPGSERSPAQHKKPTITTNKNNHQKNLLPRVKKGYQGVNRPYRVRPPQHVYHVNQHGPPQHVYHGNQPGPPQHVYHGNQPGPLQHVYRGNQPGPPQHVYHGNQAGPPQHVYHGNQAGRDLQANGLKEDPFYPIWKK